MRIKFLSQGTSILMEGNDIKQIHNTKLVRYMKKKFKKAREGTSVSVVVLIQTG